MATHAGASPIREIRHRARSTMGRGWGLCLTIHNPTIPGGPGARGMIVYRDEPGISPPRLRVTQGYSDFLADPFFTPFFTLVFIPDI